MKFLYVSVAAGGMVLSFGAGFKARQHWQPPQQVQRCTAATATPAPTSLTPQIQALTASLLRNVNQSAHEREVQPTEPLAASWQTLWARLGEGAQQDGTREAFEGLVALAKSDPKTLEQLLSLFETQAGPNSRLLLKSLLSQIGGPEVLDFSLRLAGSSDPAKRRDGFDLLHRYPEQSAEARGLIKAALTKEDDPEALVNAVSALRPGGVAPEEAKETLGLVRGLTQHGDPMVRRQSIITLAQLDGSADFVEPLRQALTDESPEVRQGAIWAAAEAGNRSEPVKTALMAVVNDAGESPEIRSSAVRVLERFQLSHEEYASFSQARSELSTF